MIEELRPDGGGDTPEAVYDGLRTACNVLEWLPHSHRLAVLVGDAPPHGDGGADDLFPEGCPCGLDADAVTALLETEAISLYALPMHSAAEASFARLVAVHGRRELPGQRRRGRDRVVQGPAEQGVRRSRFRSAGVGRGPLPGRMDGGRCLPGGRRDARPRLGLPQPAGPRGLLDGVTMPIKDVLDRLEDAERRGPAGSSSRHCPRPARDGAYRRDRLHDPQRRPAAPGLQGWAVLGLVHQPGPFPAGRDLGRAGKVPGAVPAGAADPRGTDAGGENSGSRRTLAGAARPYRRPAFPNRGARARAAARRRPGALRHDRGPLRRPAVLVRAPRGRAAIRPSRLICASACAGRARAACRPIPPRCSKRGLSAEERAAYTLSASHCSEAAERDRANVRLSEALAHAQGRLHSYAEHGEVYAVTYEMGGRVYTSTVRRDDLTVHDLRHLPVRARPDFDLTSLVGVMREAGERGCIRTTEAGARRQARMP